MGRRAQYLTKKFNKSGKDYFQTSSFYTINKNYYVVNYVMNKSSEGFAVHWHYISNTRQPYFLGGMTGNGNKHFIKVDAHAILRYMKRTPDYKPKDKVVFAKEAMNVTTDLLHLILVDANYVSPSGLWPLTSKEMVDGFLHVKTFIHKSMLNKRQLEIYKEGLSRVSTKRIPIYKESLNEFDIQVTHDRSYSRTDAS